ncbi:MAG: hypothetical protein HQM14_05740 [SAR324 cluster bacterium]|nr:hypothetical protein [SAR324 cluster bacterium]
MKAIVVALGSVGDVLSFLKVAIALRQRGHDVVVLSHSWDEPLIRDACLEFHPILDLETAKEALNHPDLFHPGKRLEIIETHFYFPAIQPVYRFIQMNVVGEITLAVAPPWAFGARLAQEKHGISLVTVLQAPWHLHEGSHQFIPMDNERYAPLDRIRQDIGLGPLMTSITSWRCSPEKIIGLFPGWFGKHEAWPSHAHLTNFPGIDQSVTGKMNERLEEFLAANGGPPLVFTPGTAMAQGKNFFQESIDACQLIGKRAIFLSLYPKQVPFHLPENIQHYDYIPLNRLLPHADALIYHGGIGTCAHGLRAGIPHLAMPIVYDHYDNANRIQELGVGDQIERENYKAATVAEKLENLLNSSSVQESCQNIKAQLKQENAIEMACSLIESTIR